MIYQEYEPCEALRPFIRCYWSLEQESADGEQESERIFPDGCIEWIFHFGDSYEKREAGGEWESQGRSFVHGQLKRFIEIRPTGKTGICSVRFEPAGLYPFIQGSVNELTERTLLTTDLWPGAGARFMKAAEQCTSMTERLRLMERFLLENLRPARHDAGIERLIAKIRAANGCGTLEDWMIGAEDGRRTLERRFSESTGLSPKVFARIVRFNYALRLIRAKDFSSFTAVAYDGGFYDQAHFIRDFRYFAGLNPKTYFADDPELVRFFNLS